MNLVERLQMMFQEELSSPSELAFMSHFVSIEVMLKALEPHFIKLVVGCKQEDTS